MNLSEAERRTIRKIFDPETAAMLEQPGLHMRDSVAGLAELSDEELVGVLRCSVVALGVALDDAKTLIARAATIGAAIVSRSQAGDRQNTDPPRRRRESPPEGPHIRRIRELLAEGKSHSEIRDVLNREGFTTPKGRPWARGNVSTTIHYWGLSRQ